MTKGRSRLLDSSQIPSVLKVEHDVGVGGHVLAVMLNPRTRGADSDLPPPLFLMTAWISLAAVSPTSNRMMVSCDVCPTPWEETKRISLLAASERAFITPMPLIGDSIRALGSLATPWYLTDQLETRGS